MTQILRRSSYQQFALAIAAILSGVMAAICQTSESSNPKVPPPEPPLVRAASTGLEWTIQYSQPQAASPTTEQGPTYLKSKKVSKAGNLRREISTWSDGSQAEDWVADDVLIHREPTWAPNFLVAQKTKGSKKKAKAGQPKMATGGSITARLSDLNDDFGLPWISLDYYKETTVLRGKSCHLYEASNAVLFPGDRLTDAVKAQQNDPNVSKEIRGLIQAQMENEKQLASNITRAWIDANTRLPLVVESRGVTMQYSYSAGPDALTLPPLYEKEYAVFKQLYPE